MKQQITNMKQCIQKPRFQYKHSSPEQLFSIEKSQSVYICQWQSPKLINIMQHYILINYIHTKIIYKIMCICMNIIMSMIIIVNVLLYV